LPTQKNCRIVLYTFQTIYGNTLFMQTQTQAALSCIEYTFNFITPSFLCACGPLPMVSRATLAALFHGSPATQMKNRPASVQKPHAEHISTHKYFNLIVIYYISELQQLLAYFAL
jgi:hypothetical protein